MDQGKREVLRVRLRVPADDAAWLSSHRSDVAEVIRAGNQIEPGHVMTPKQYQRLIEQQKQK
jgi:hypothetical protein